LGEEDKRFLYDLTVPLHPGMVIYPGDPLFTKEFSYSLAKGAGFNVSAITLGSHTGTHVDAPAHFYADGITLEQIPLTCFLGPAKVIEINAKKSIFPHHLIDKGIKEGDRILFKTANSEFVRARSFHPDYIYLSPEAAKYLVDAKVILVGFDYFSIDDFYNEDNPCHKILLAKNIPILEGLNLADVPEGNYYLMALPLKISGSDAGPVRAVLMGEKV